MLGKISRVKNEELSQCHLNWKSRRKFHQKFRVDKIPRASLASTQWWLNHVATTSKSTAPILCNILFKVNNVFQLLSWKKMIITSRKSQKSDKKETALEHWPGAAVHVHFGYHPILCSSHSAHVPLGLFCIARLQPELSVKRLHSLALTTQP